MPIATVISILQAAAQLAPVLESVVPIISKMLNGTELTAADLAALDATAADLNAQLAGS